MEKFIPVFILDLVLSDFKFFSKVTVIKTVFSWQREGYKPMRQNSTQKHIYENTA